MCDSNVFVRQSDEHLSLAGVLAVWRLKLHDIAALDVDASEAHAVE